MNVFVSKNNSESPFHSWNPPLDFSVLKTENSTKEAIKELKNAPSESIQFHFVLRGQADFIFAKNREQPLPKERGLVVYTPIDTPFEVILQPDSRLISIYISIEKFHQLFSEHPHYMWLINTDNKDRKYVREIPIPPTQITILHQMWSAEEQTKIKQLYLRAKTYELLSLIFSRPEAEPIFESATCPFLSTDKNIEKIRVAKELLIKNMNCPPSLGELADTAGLSLKGLKTHFKKVYGDTVFNFLSDYKMEYARHLLSDEKQSVNEVSDRLGYSTSSHFIKAFKKKFGVTPKQYGKSSD